MRISVSLLVFSAAVCGWALAVNAAPASHNAVTVEVAGDPQIVIPTERFNCPAPPELRPKGQDVPDSPPRAFRDARGSVHFFSNTILNYSFTGSDLGHLAHPDCGRMMSSGIDANPAHFHNREWLVSPYTLDGTHIYSLVHNEYFGWTYDNSCALPAATGKGKHCWYIAITSAWSDNGGRTYAKPPAGYDWPVAAPPYRFSSDMVSAGYGNPTNIIRNPHDNYYYAVIGAFEYGAQKAGRCVIRTRDFRTWRFWTGTDFSGEFVNPYSANAAPETHSCAIVYGGSIMSLVYSPSLDMFIGVGNGGGKFGGGADYSSSPDLIHWGKRQTLLTAPDTYAIRYPSIIDPQSSDRNFDTVGSTPYLYFVQFGGNEGGRWLPPRQIGRLPLRIGTGH